MNTLKKTGIIIIILSVLLVNISCDKTDFKASQLDIEDEMKISQVNYDDISNEYIGSMLPRILYANKEIVAFESGGGIFIYDLVNLKIKLSLDVSAFMKENLPEDVVDKIKPWSVMLNDGSDIIISFTGIDDASYVAIFSYNMKHETVKTLTEDAYNLLKEKIYSCEYLKIDHGLYFKSTGMIAHIDKQSFVYLMHTDFKVDSIKIILVSDDKEKVFDVFNEHRTD